MEGINQNFTVAHSLNSTQNDPEPNKEQVPALPANAAPEGAGGESSPEQISGEASEAPRPLQVVKRGRGRPRKHVADGRSATPPPPRLSIQVYGGDGGVKRGRGRPRGTGRVQILSSIGGIVAETAGRGFKPFWMTVNPGEDMISKLTLFNEMYPTKEFCIISGSGSVSSVTIREPGTTNPSRYQGCFQIMSLTGSCTYSTIVEDAHTRKLLLNVSLAETDGNIFGGNIASSLIAASPIVLIMATFNQNINKRGKKRHSSESSTTPSMSGNPDSWRGDFQKVPRLADGEPSCPSSPTSTMKLMAPTNGGDDQNMLSEYGSGDDLEPVDDDVNMP